FCQKRAKYREAWNMEQENRAGCILHGCGVLAALAGLCAASGAACVFALTPGWRVWALPVFFLLALAGAACGLLLYAAGSALQILCDIRGRPDKLRYTPPGKIPVSAWVFDSTSSIGR
ncbi:hypothetical protein, partial [Ruthenibacterium lactatiformans]|uniref:hypothetical protein n=1 Tax=Ruthenibacterium lactatiformans TaxID=1550024 RepID=UPI00399F1894